MYLRSMCLEYLFVAVPYNFYVIHTFIRNAPIVTFPVKATCTTTTFYDWVVSI